MGGASLSKARYSLDLRNWPRHTLVQSLNLHGAAHASSRHSPHTDDIRRHVAAGRTLRLLRIRLDSGDGYITATELVPHDGSALVATEPSRIAFWLGHWSLGTLGSLI